MAIAFRHYRQLMMAVLLLLVNACFLTANAQHQSCHTRQKDTAAVMLVTLTELKANLSKYDGKWIETEGSFDIGFEYSSITAQAADHSAGKPASFWVNFDGKLPCLRQIEQYNEKRVKLKGRVNAGSKGHMASYDGTIEDAFYIEQL